MRVSFDELRASESAVRQALEAFHRDGLVLIEGLPTHDEATWANATKTAFVRLLPTSARGRVREDAYWHVGDATVPSFNDYTNQGREATLADEETTAAEHPGWYGGALKLHQDGCYLDEPPRLKLYAPWGPPATSVFADGLRAVAALPTDQVVTLRTTPMTVTYEAMHSAEHPVLRADGSMCWNPGDGCVVEHTATDAATTAAFDALATALSDDGWRLAADTGLAFVVDNSRTLHGRSGDVRGRRRVVGGEAPANAVSERWAELAKV